jgi:phosphocarrier protein
MSESMVSREVVVGSAAGLHARPAAVLVKAVTGISPAVSIAKGDVGPLDARSILNLMRLGAAKGDLVVLSAEGEGAEAAVAAVAALVESELDGPDPA